MRTGMLSAVVIVAVVIAAIAVILCLRWSRTRRLVRLLDDPRYSHAIDLFSHHWSSDSCFQHAVDYLVGQGVNERSARADLTKLLGSVATMEWRTWGVQDGRSHLAGRRTSRLRTRKAMRHAAAAGYAMRPK